MSEQTDRLRVWALARLQEPSTVAGLISAVSIIVGHTITPEYTTAIVTLAGLFASAVAVVTPQHRRRPDDQSPEEPQS